jgi:hypothetical protein
MDRNEHLGPLDPSDLKIEALLRLDGEYRRADTPRDLSHRLAVTSWAERATPQESHRFVDAPLSVGSPGGSRVFRNTWWSRAAMAAALGLACVVVLRPVTQEPIGPASPGDSVAMVVDNPSLELDPYLLTSNAEAEELIGPVINTYAYAGEDLDVYSSELTLLTMDLDL